MKINKGSLLFILILMLCSVSLIFITVKSDPLNVFSSRESNLNLSNTEQSYIQEKGQINVYISSNLDYMDKGFLEEYLKSIIEQSDLKMNFVKVKSKSDISLVVMDDNLRKQTDKYLFTAPVMQSKGSIFINQDYESGILKGVCEKNSLSEKNQSKITYDGYHIQFTEADSCEEVLELAIKQNADCIIGDQSALAAQIREQGMEDKFENQYAELYTNNISFLVPVSNETLYNIMNACIHTSDLSVLSKHAQEHQYGMTDSFVKENNFKDAVTLIIIILVAVLITFFIYYHSNKNLYSELTERMNQLIASKQELKTTFNGVSYYMAELDTNGMILDINTAFFNFVDQDCVGKYIGTVFDVPEEHFADMIRETMENRSSSAKEITFKRKMFEMNLFPIRGQKGEIEKLLFMASDVTKEKMAERQLLQDNKMIAVGQLAAGVAHEIRNPLGIIRNYCYVLKNMKDESAQKQAIQVIEKSVDTAGNIIDTLLNFSKISNQNIEEVYLKQHIDSVLTLNRGLLKKKQINIEVDCQQDFKVNLPMESFDIVFMNLVTNAIDAMGENGSLQITIDHCTDAYSIAVKDNGNGIEEDILDEIFNPFFTTKSTVEGNGLGLYIVYNEIQKMNGQIHVASRVGEGTTFRVTLPFRLEDEVIE